MSKFLKALAVIGLIAGTMAATSGTALAQHHGGGGWHGGGGGWHGGGGWRGGWGPGVGFGIGFGAPYYYGGPYYGGPGCGYARVRIWRHGHWALRRAWRCY